MTLKHPVGPHITTFDILRMVAAGVEFDPLEFSVQIMQEYGGFARVQAGPVPYYQVTVPELVHQILVTDAAKYHKPKRMRDALKAFAGNGLLLSEGDFWKRQRKLAQPAFHSKRIETYANTMVDYTEHMLESWRAGGEILLDREMMKLTLSIVSKTLFDAEVASDAARVGVLLTDVLEASNNRLMAVFSLPEWIRTPGRRRTERAMHELDGIIQRFIDERRRSGQDKGDLLSMLLMAVDETGSMDDKQLRDEAMTLFIAGHETTAMALTWSWYLLAQNPDKLAKLQAELDTVLAGRAPTLADLPNLPYTEMVVKEAMRLYPPAPGVSREPIEPVSIAGFDVPQGSLMNIQFFAMHRDPGYFPEPERFLPERFDKANAASIPDYAYLPFGGGPRVCIGNMFAMMEARLALAAMAQRFELALVPGQTVRPRQTLTIRPATSIRMTLTQRQPSRQYHPEAVPV
jgi:cytochrome P450